MGTPFCVGLSGSGLCLKPSKVSNWIVQKQTLATFRLCLGLSDICPSRETDVGRDTGLRAGVG